MSELPHIVLLGSGFVGRRVADALAARATVSVLDLPTHPALATRGPEGRAVLLEEIDRTGAVAVVNTCGLLRGSDKELLEANSLWPTWLVGALEGSPVRLVHVGSASEYGDPGTAEPVDESTPARPKGMYGETKWAGTRAVLAARAGGLDAVVARGFNLVDRQVSPISPLHQIREDVVSLPPEGGEVTLWWPATTRDFIDLGDLAEGLARLALVPEVPDIVNLCSGVGISFAEIARALAAELGKELRIASLDQPGIEAVVGDPTRLEEVTGLVPIMSPDRLARTLLAPADLVSGPKASVS